MQHLHFVFVRNFYHPNFGGDMKFNYAEAFAGAPVKTVLGHRPEIETFSSGNSTYPIAGKVKNSFGFELNLQWTIFGEASLGEMFNLVLAPELEKSCRN